MVPIIRTCSRALLAVLLASASAQAAAPTGLQTYVRARVADWNGASQQAAEAYAAALLARPDDETLALRGLLQALKSGDQALVLRAAHALETMQRALPDARLFLASEAIGKGDWANASRQLDAVEREGSFAFLTPVLRSWIDVAARRGDPLARLSAVGMHPLASAYGDDHRPLLLLALGQNEAAIVATRALGVGERSVAVQLAVAAGLAARGDRANARALLNGNDPALVRARDLLATTGKLPGAVTSVSSASAFLFARVAVDLIRDDAPSMAALTLARLACFADPKSEGAQMALGRALMVNGEADQALAQLTARGEAGLFARQSRDLRFELLMRAGRTEEALALARGKAPASAAPADDFLDIALALMRLERPGEAAQAYQQAIASFGDSKNVPWNYWLLYGAAADRAGDWKAAKPALQRALALAPDEPSVLNHFGYAMIEAGEDVEQALKLIARASALRPEDPAITDSLGWALFRHGQVEQAIPILERAYASDPTISEIGEHLGDVYWAAGRRVEARYVWRGAALYAELPAATARLAQKIDLGPELIAAGPK